MKSLDGKVAWITGAGTGIGEASAKALAEAGAYVVLSGRRQAPLDEVVNAIIAAGGKAEAAQLDVADASATQSIADEIMVMKDGRVVERGPTEAIFEAPQQAYTQRLIAAALRC